MGVEASARVVLVVEDEAFVRAAIAEEFRSFGWHVLEAASGEQAVALVATQPHRHHFHGHSARGNYERVGHRRCPAGEPPRHARPLYLRQCLPARASGGRKLVYRQTLRARLHN